MSLSDSGTLDLVLLGKFPCPLGDSNLSLLIANWRKIRQWSLDDSGETDWVLDVLMLAFWLGGQATGFPRCGLRPHAWEMFRCWN